MSADLPVQLRRCSAAAVRCRRCGRFAPATLACGTRTERSGSSTARSKSSSSPTESACGTAPPIQAIAIHACVECSCREAARASCAVLRARARMCAHACVCAHAMRAHAMCYADGPDSIPPDCRAISAALDGLALQVRRGREARDGVPPVRLCRLCLRSAEQPNGPFVPCGKETAALCDWSHPVRRQCGSLR